MTQEFVATIIAASGTELSLDFIESLLQKTEATHTEWLAEGCAVDLFFEDGEAHALQKVVASHLGNMPCDVIVQPSQGRQKKFLIADMESTIIEQEMLDELADLIGLRDKVASITRRAMNNEIDFAAALRERVALLAGQPESILKDVASRITYTAGAQELLRGMKASGAQCWLVSGGFTCFVEPVAKQLGFDRFYANTLVVQNGALTGEVAAPILDKDSKQKFLQQACAELQISLAETMAVGDGANDIPMLAACNAGGGLGVAFEAKPAVRAVVAPQINHTDLQTLLYVQGIAATAA